MSAPEIVATPTVCYCGHDNEEHDRQRLCTAQECACESFEPDYTYAAEMRGEELYRMEVEG